MNDKILFCYRRTYVASNGVSWCITKVGVGVVAERAAPRARGRTRWKTQCCTAIRNALRTTSCACGGGWGALRPPRPPTTSSCLCWCHRHLRSRRSRFPPPRSSGSSGTARSPTCPSSSRPSSSHPVSHHEILSSFFLCHLLFPPTSSHMCERKMLSDNPRHCNRSPGNFIRITHNFSRITFLFLQTSSHSTNFGYKHNDILITSIIHLYGTSKYHFYSKMFYIHIVSILI